MPDSSNPPEVPGTHSSFHEWGNRTSKKLHVMLKIMLLLVAETGLHPQGFLLQALPPKPSHSRALLGDHQWHRKDAELLAGWTSSPPGSLLPLRVCASSLGVIRLTHLVLLFCYSKSIWFFFWGCFCTQIVQITEPETHTEKHEFPWERWAWLPPRGISSSLLRTQIEMIPFLATKSSRCYC